MKNNTSKKIEPNIYVETRSGAIRFIVAVYPLPKETRTCSSDEYKDGLQWARKCRVALFDQKLGKFGSPSGSSSKPLGEGFPSTLPVAKQQDNELIPGTIQLRDVFDSFRDMELKKLSGEKAETSRLKKLDECFGHLTLGQVDYNFVERWKTQRLSGVLGSGRNPNRGGTDDHDGSDKPLTKHQRHWRKKRGMKIPEALVFPVSTQSVRHELVLLRRAVDAYFKANNLVATQGAWLHAQHLMTMDLPPACEPRDRRLSDREIVAIIGEIETAELKSAILFALLTTLRCSELISLQWDDVDLPNKIVRLRKLGHQKSKAQEQKPETSGLQKSKTTTRDVPLMPGACVILQELGLKKKGPIFPGTPSGFSQAWRRAADRAGIFDARLHDCRRESISRLIETCNLQLSAVAVFSGHSDLATLERHYVRINPGRLAVRISEMPGAATMMPSL